MLPAWLYFGYLILRVTAQVSREELAPLLEGLNQLSHTTNNIQTPVKRVPLSTDDDTVAPLIDLQVFAPPAVPRNSTSCSVNILSHSFGQGSYNSPTVVQYAPPKDSSCGEIGKWATISMNVSVYSIGTQYDRLSAIYLHHVEIMRHSSAEPTKTGTIWNTVKDVTYYAPLFAEEGDFMMDFSNIIDESLLITAPFEVNITLTFYAPTLNFPTPKTADLILPLSNLSPNLTNFFTISDDIGGKTDVSLPQNTIEAFVEVYASGNSAEEFWYSNTPDEYLPLFPESTGLIGKGPFREVQVLIDDQLAGVVWPYAVIYTGGICPSMWRPLTSYGAYDQPSYFVDVTPFLPTLLENSKTHVITLRVLGQGKNATINSNWFVSGSVHVRRGQSNSTTTGVIQQYEIGDLDITTTGGSTQGNSSVWTKVTASRHLKISTLLHTSEGDKVASFEQRLLYQNDARYADDGWLQWVNQTTVGTSVGKHGSRQVLRDAFDYPLQMSSNYSLYTQEYGGYGAEVKSAFTRALQHPTAFYRSIHSTEHAKGWIGMDNWPGLRHAVNGTGSNDQQFAFVDDRQNTYFRDLATKNDGWVRDHVSGSLRDGNPPVPKEQIYGPGGGPGFRRDLQPRAPKG